MNAPTENRSVKIPFKYKFFGFILLLIAGSLTLLITAPDLASWILSYKKQCKVLRVEPFMKNMINMAPRQSNKFSVICDDGFICRAEDTGFAGVKAGDTIEFRGFPELSSLGQFGKCDHAQLLKFFPQNH